MAEQAAHVTMLQRSPTYVLSLAAEDTLADALRGLPARAARLRDHPLEERAPGMFIYQFARRARPGQDAAHDMAQEQLGADYDVATHFTPRYDPWDQRLCLVPDGDLFAAIRSGRASVVTDTSRRSRNRDPAPLGPRDRGRPHRHRHGSRAAVRSAAWSSSSTARPSTLAESDDLQGHDVQRRPEPRLRLRLHQRLVDAQGRSHGGVRVRLLNYMEQHGYAVRRRSATRPRWRRSPSSTSWATSSARSTGSRSRARGAPWRLHQNYALDLLDLRFSPLDDGALAFERAPAERTRTEPDQVETARPRPLGPTMSSTMNLRGRTAVVTGAAGGIGRAVAVSLARRGCELALADVDEAGLEETAALLRPHGVRASAHRLDVADREAVAALPAAVAAEHAGVDVLVNNAGVALGGTFEEVDEADFEWLFGVNFWGVVRMTRAFLPCSGRATRPASSTSPASTGSSPRPGRRPTRRASSPSAVLDGAPPRAGGTASA